MSNELTEQEQDAQKRLAARESKRAKWAEEMLKAHKGKDKVTVVSCLSHDAEFGTMIYPTGGMMGAGTKGPTVLIYGRANSIGRNSIQLDTRGSVGTHLTMAQFEIFVGDVNAYLQTEGGYMLIMGGAKGIEQVEKAKSDLVGGDRSAPMTNKQLKEGVAGASGAPVDSVESATNRV